jgi:hypothetical protein
MNEPAALPPWVQAQAALDEAAQQETHDLLIGDKTIEHYALALVTYKNQLDQLEELRKGIQARYDAVRKVDLPEAMRAAGLVVGNKGSFTFTAGKIHLETKTHASYDKTREDEFFAWLEANGHGGIVKQTVNAQTLTATVKVLISDGAPLPPQVSTFDETVAKFTKARG